MKSIGKKPFDFVLLITLIYNFSISVDPIDVQVSCDIWGVPKKATRLFENSKKSNSLTCFVLPFLNC